MFNFFTILNSVVSNAVEQATRRVIIKERIQLMKLKYWVSAALTLLTMFTGYQQYTHTKHLVEQFLPERLISETKVIAFQLEDYVEARSANQPAVMPNIQQRHIAYSLVMSRQPNTQVVSGKPSVVADTSSPSWFRNLFSSYSLNYSHTFHIDNVEQAVLNSEISSLEIVNRSWWTFNLLAILFLLLQAATFYLTNRQDKRHEIMVSRLRAGLISIENGEFNLVKQLRNDKLFSGLVVEFNQMVDQLDVQHQADSREKKVLSDAALFDDLTGFGSKPLFSEAMQTQLCSDNPTGHLVMLRLTSLEQVNSELGSYEGDTYISKVASILAKSYSIPKTLKTVFRLNGRDFLAILPTEKSLIIDLWAEELKNLLIDIDNSAYKYGCGNFSIVPFDKASQTEHLLACLDSGLSQAMAHSANSYSIIESIDECQNGRTKWFEIVSKIIETEGVILKKQQLKHCEQNHNLYNFELFTSFELDGVSYEAKNVFAAASRFSLGSKLDQIIIEETLSFSQEATVANARYLIKLSFESVLDKDFYYWLKHWLGTQSKLASQLSFQLPELAITQDFITAKRFISMLHSANSSVCLDYEGAQHSYQLSHSIGELEVDMIKINGHYTHSVNIHKERASFIASLVEIAHSINVPVIASQVEHDDEWSSLAALGVDAVQGNLFGHVRPV